jgi:hypothetical protein
MSEYNATDLRRDHAAIEMLSARLARLIERDDASPAELALSLDHLVATVDDHLSVEDSMIYALAVAAEPDAEARVERMRGMFDQLKSDWGAYFTGWTAEAIAADRQGFVAATRAMLPRLRDRVKLENELLYALSIDRRHATGAGETPRR